MQRIVLTGGPGAGKTVISHELAERHPDHFILVPEAATQVYQQLQTRWDALDDERRRDVQRKIYHLQLRQEEDLARRRPDAILLLDRGTVDGAAYWPDGPDDYWHALGTTHGRELQRYDAVIWMQSCAAIADAYDGNATNAWRSEDAPAALSRGQTLQRVWSTHPNLHLIDAFPQFQHKLIAVEALLRTICVF